jgi:type II secretory pathway component PulM
MKAFLSPSESLRRLEPRERRVVVGGAAVALLSLVTVLVVLPFADRWSRREQQIAASRAQVVRLEALIANEPTFRRVLDEQRRRRAGRGARLVVGETPALAASALQTLIRDYAVRSGVTLDRIDVVGEAQADSVAMPSIPMQLTARGDIHGLVDLLYQLQYGEKLLLTDEITITVGSPQPNGTQLLMLSLRLRGPFASAGASS